MYETINTHKVITQFRHMMQLNSQYHVMRLVGDGDMGKTHLLTKVLPLIAKDEYQAICSILDLRNNMHDVPDILHMACSQLASIKFENYYETHQAWTNRPKVEIKGFLAKFSRIDISAKDSLEDTRSRDRQLTTQFTRDLVNNQEHLLLLLFDTVNEASEAMQTWLMDNFLVHVSPLRQVRVIIAGRTLPEAHGSYAHLCQSYALQSVTDVAEYITYCQHQKANLPEQSIRDFAKACRYRPGAFAKLVVPTFIE